MQEPLIILTGPTAVGKTALSIQLAKKIGGEIISADSMQVYKGMDIGTAKITKEEMKGIPHHLIDVFEPDEPFNIHLFQKMAKEAMRDIISRKKIPIVVGGTGFYIQSLLYDIEFTETEKESTYREQLIALSQKEGTDYLHKMLKKVDPVSATKIHPNNVKRVIRALEYYMQTKSPISEHNERQEKKKSPYNFAYFVLTMPRERLYQRINQRVDLMMTKGLLEEVKALHNKGYHKEMVSMKGLGYKEILEYLDGAYSLEEAVYIIKRDTRHFAKRQLTWFKREQEVIWLDVTKYENEKEGLLNKMLKDIEEKGII